MYIFISHIYIYTYICTYKYIYIYAPFLVRIGIYTYRCINMYFDAQVCMARIRMGKSKTRAAQ